MKVLVIEDSVFFRKTIQSMLASEGYEVLAAGTGEEGLKLAQQSAPDLILLDMMMPRLDGMMVLRILRGSPATREIPVIVMSGNTRPADVAAAEHLKIVAYLDKEHMKATDLVQHVKHQLAR